MPDGVSASGALTFKITSHIIAPVNDPIAALASTADIGRSLRIKREAAGLTQREVARRARMQPAVLCRLENGGGNPTVETIRKVLKAIGRT